MIVYFDIFESNYFYKLLNALAIVHAYNSVQGYVLIRGCSTVIYSYIATG